MKKHIYRDDEIDKINLDESFIKSFRWLDDEEGHPVNLEVEIDWNGQKDLVEDFDFMSIRTRMVFSLVVNAKFCFEFKKPYTIGGMEISAFEYNYNPDHLDYSIEFQFYFSPVGSVKFNCSEFYFEIIERMQPEEQ